MTGYRICEACASTFGLKTFGVKDHEWDAEDAKDKQKEQSSSQDEDESNGSKELVYSDDEEDVPVRRE